MTIQNPQEYFQKLSLVELQSYAHGWAALYPNVQKISLFRGLPEEKVPHYVFVVYILPFESYLRQKPSEADPEYFEKQQQSLQLVAPYNDAWDGCGHIKDLRRFYNGDPPENFEDEWFWFHVAPGEDIYDYQIVQPPYFWLLYESPLEASGKKERKDTVLNEQVLALAKELKKADSKLTKPAIYEHSAMIGLYGGKKQRPSEKYFKEMILKDLNKST